MQLQPLSLALPRTEEPRAEVVGLPADQEGVVLFLGGRIQSPTVLGDALASDPHEMARSLPFSVRKDFRVKCYGIAALQMLFICAGTMILDVIFNYDDHLKLGWIILGASLVSSVASLSALWFVMKRHPWNLILSLATTVQATLVWSMLDFVVFLDSGNMASQMVGIMAVTLSLNVLVVQIPVGFERESDTILLGATLGWLIAVSIDVWVLYLVAMPVHTAILPGLVTLISMVGLLMSCSDKLMRCNPDDFLSVCFLLNGMQFLVITMPFIIFFLSVSGAGSSPLDGSSGDDQQNQVQEPPLPEALQDTA